MDPHASGLIAAIAVSLLAVLVHYEGLRAISYSAERAPGPRRLRIVVLILVVLIAHASEAGLFAITYWLGAGPLHFGRFVGDAPKTAFQFYYFALETYTTQSVGDLYPIGGLRVVASLEPLVGLLLVGWSTSLTFLAMRRFWSLDGETSDLAEK